MERSNVHVSNEEYLSEAARNLDMVLISEDGKLLGAEGFEAISRAILYIEKVLYGPDKEANIANTDVLDRA